MYTDQELIDAYLINYRTKNDDYFWAFEKLHELEKIDTEHAWSLTVQMISQTTDEATLAYIAAGPLENILIRHADSFIDRAAELARKDPHFKSALSHVWGLEKLNPELYERIKKFLPQV